MKKDILTSYEIAFSMHESFDEHLTWITATVQNRPWRWPHLTLGIERIFSIFGTSVLLSWTDKLYTIKVRSGAKLLQVPIVIKTVKTEEKHILLPLINIHKLAWFMSLNGSMTIILIAWLIDWLSHDVFNDRWLKYSVEYVDSVSFRLRIIKSWDGWRTLRLVERESQVLEFSLDFLQSPTVLFSLMCCRWSPFGKFPRFLAEQEWLCRFFYFTVCMRRWNPREIGSWSANSLSRKPECA